MSDPAVPGGTAHIPVFPGRMDFPFMKKGNYCRWMDDLIIIDITFFGFFNNEKKL